ncbi:MAG: ribulokinase [Massilibacteroides sp.]|nr:ribulokinase [Massilibacteroides sp.]MDD3063425.1 ribulokinase [Massilibacteroides sp.]MDD4660470.1 ribulokinase [Massilibacteroides sp.]
MKNTDYSYREKKFVIGIDYGTDSVRSLLADAVTGEELAVSIFEYPRWKNGLYSDSSENRFRQHPLDYIEGLEYVVKDLLRQIPDAKDYLRSIALDTTGSTPCLINEEGVPLALLDKYKKNPNAMFILWKDHTAMQEAQTINRLCEEWNMDYRIYSGMNYSSEWLWAKALHVLNMDKELRHDAYSIVEHCDWIPALLTGVKKAKKIKRSRSSAGHKALWAKEWGGFPSQSFLSTLSPFFQGFAEQFEQETYTCDLPAGFLCDEWAKKLGLSTNVLIGIGNTDAHAGAVGAGVRYKTLVQNLGTSMCNMAVMPVEKVGDKLMDGISGQVKGSIIPGMFGFEAGMSAFGDVYAWFKKMLIEPIDDIICRSDIIDVSIKEKLTCEIKERLLNQLTKKAEEIELKEDSPLAVEWLNGRRNPYINYRLKGIISGLSLSTDAAEIYRTLVEATAFGAKAIVDHLVKYGVEIEEIIGTGGISQKSPFVMQVLADVLCNPIHVSDSKQSCALGSVMFAATIAGIYPNVEEAQKTIVKKTSKTYFPDIKKSEIYAKRYLQYRKLSLFSEEQLTLPGKQG